MSDTDLEYSLMLEGRLNLMLLPPGAIAWLWDRPSKQVDAAETLATSAKAYDNPIVDSSLLRSDHNVLILKCEGGECFRIYPDGGYSYDTTPMDIGGCTSVLRGDWGGCPYEANETNPIVDYEHNMGKEPRAAQKVPQNMTNLAEPMMDEDSAGLAGGHGMGTGSPTVGFIPDDQLEQLLNPDFEDDEFDNECRGYSDEELNELAIAMGTY